MSAAQLFIQRKTVRSACLCLEALVYFHLCRAKIYSLACLAAVVLAFYNSVRDSSPIISLGCLDSSATRYTCSVIYTCALPWCTYWCRTKSPPSRWFLEPLFCGPSYYEPFSFPTAVHLDELIITLGLIFPCLFIDRMFALIRLW